jgi:translocation and assembly module TamB
MTENAPENAAAPEPAPTPRTRRRGWAWWHLTLLPLAALLLALAVALAALWVWSGTDGSLATALRWAGHWTALTTHGVHGDIRHGGTVEDLTWSQDGLHVQVRGARIAWSPGALWHRLLHVHQLAAAQVVIDDQSTPAPDQHAAGAPQSLALPLAVRLDAFAVAQLRWNGPPAVTVNKLSGSYQYASNQHKLEIGQAQIETEQGRAALHGRAALQADAPMALDAVLSGTLQSQAAPPLALQAALHGPLADLEAKLDAQTAQATKNGAADQQAHIQAQLALWAAQPLTQAHAQVQRLDLQTLLAAFWPQAPRTAITGQADLAPMGHDGHDGWRASVDLTNAERSLPIERAQASVEWRDQTLTVRTLTASGAGSDLSANGHWQLDARQGAIDATLTAPGAALAIKGELAPERGAGRAQADVRDAARLLAWVRTLPGLKPALAGLPDAAQGQARGQLDWRGGWRDAQTAAVRAELAVPALTLQGAALGEPIQVQDLRANLDGTLAQARLAFDGRVRQGQRQGALHLAANGGQVPGSAPAAWRVSVGRLNVQAQDPQWGAWALTTAAPVDLALKPGGAFDVGAGTVTLTHGEQTPNITLAWDASRWDGRLLTTGGRVQGLSLAWIDQLAGQPLQDAGITGDVALAAAWRARIGAGQPLDLHASLERTAGDLTLTANDPQTGLQTQVEAGLSQARITLEGSGRELRAQAQWMSERAGQISADLRTQLNATPQGIGWAWPEDAPLTGQARVRLPQLAVWSTLAPPGWRLRGALEADAHVAGTRSDPRITGTLTGQRLALRSVVDGVQLSGGQLHARFDGTKLILDQLSLRGAGRRSGQDSSGGTLTATGEAGWIEGRPQAKLAVTLDHLRASLRDDRKIIVSGNAQGALDGHQITARGQLKVDQASITLPSESAPALGDDVVVHDAQNHTLHGHVTVEAVAVQDKRAPGAALQADIQVQIDLGQQFRVQGQGIDTRLTGALTLAAQGPLTAMPRLTGTINTVDGHFQAYGQKLTIARGALRFTGVVSNPALDILALRPIYDANQKAGVQVQGTALLPSVRLYSDPVLPDSQILAWLLLGHAAPTTGAESAMLQSAALALLGGRDSKGLAANLGLDELSLSNATDAGGVQNASVTLGKRLSKRLYASYQQSLSGATGSLMLFYQLSRRWQLRAQTGQDAGLDLIFSLMFD